MVKGSAVRFIAGKYAGKKGWVNTEGNSDHEVTSVIVDLGRRGEKYTYVYTSSLREESLSEKPDSYAEAVIHQCPDIEKDLVEVCRKLAKQEIERDPVGFNKVVQTSIHAAVNWRQAKGHKAYYHKIDWNTKKS